MRLLLLRHAKSDWSGKMDDHERPLSARGRQAAPLVGAYLAGKNYVPALVLCSTAVRAQETLELLVTHLPAAPKIRYDRGLYLAEWPQLLQAVQHAPAKASPLLLVGHNPGLEQLTIALALQPGSVAEKARSEKMTEKFPTAALAVLDFDVRSWRSVKPGLGRLVDYVRPKDLANDLQGDDE